VTLILVVLEPVNSSVTVVNVGHLPPLVRYSGGRVKMLNERGGLPLDADYEFQYESSEI